MRRAATFASGLCSTCHKYGGCKKLRGKYAMNEPKKTSFRGAGFLARTGLAISLLAVFLLPSCGGGTGYLPGGPGGGSGGAPTVFSNYHLTGLTTPVRDP